MGLIIFLYLLFVVVGLGLLWWASDKAVEQSLELSSLFGIRTFFIGFVLIAIATGLPELAIVIASLVTGAQEIAAGAIIGSNLGDVSLVLGIPALFIGKLYVKESDFANLMLMFTVTSLVMAFIFAMGTLTPIYGVVLILLYFASILWLWKTKSTEIVPKKVVIEELSAEELDESWLQNLFNGKLRFWHTKTGVFLKLLFSLLVVLISSKISVYYAVQITSFFPLSLEAIGATIFAVGTSFPELALSIQAVKKKEYSLAFGNSFGSILEQATLIFGLLVLGSRTSVNVISLRFVAPLMFLSYAVVGNSLLKRKKLGPREGIILLILFAIHIVYYLFFNGFY